LHLISLSFRLRRGNHLQKLTHLEARMEKPCYDNDARLCFQQLLPFSIADWLGRN
jgi:hypothetical protein